MGASPQPLLVAWSRLYLFNDKFLTIFPTNAAKTRGLCGGIAFHAFRYVSLTHSSASSLLPSMFMAIEVQYLPYLFCISGIARSFRSQHKRTISASSTESHRPSSLASHLYTQLLRANLTAYFKIFRNAINNNGDAIASPLLLNFDSLSKNRMNPAKHTYYGCTA